MKYVSSVTHLGFLKCKHTCNKLIITHLCLLSHKSQKSLSNQQEQSYMFDDVCFNVNLFIDLRGIIIFDFLVSSHFEELELEQPMGVKTEWSRRE